MSANSEITTTCPPAIEIHTRRELAQRLKCSVRHLDGLLHSGLPSIRLGKSRRFIFSEVVAWLKRKGGAA